MTTQASAEDWKELYEAAVRHAAEWRENFNVLQHALVGETGASGITVAHQLRKDAERYRWLRDEEGAHAIFSTLYFNTQTPEQLDAELDAAIERTRAVGAA